MERILRVELDQKLKLINESKLNSSMEIQSRVKYLEAQNLKLVEENNIKQNSLVGIKKKNLELEEEMAKEILKYKLQIKEKQYQVEGVKKQLSY